MIRVAALMLYFLASNVIGQPAIPDTPAGKAFASWLASFNSADAAQIRAFNEAYGYEPKSMEETLDWREQTGGFVVLRIERAEPFAIALLLGEKDSNWAARVSTSVRPEDSSKIAKMEFAGVPVPAEFAPTRMAEAVALAALSSYADKLARDDRFSGALLVARRDKILFQKAWGSASRENRIPNTIDTQFRIGSMNKMFTAVAVLQLVEAGKLSLDATVGSYLPDYPNKEVASKVKVRHLLTHTGGTGDIFGPEFDANRATLKEHSDYLKLYGSRGPDQTPGSEFRYSNYGFVLLGALIEKVSGMSYYDYVRAKVFRPAGMTSTDSLPESEAVPKRAAGYVREQAAWVSNVKTLPYRGTAAGGGYSTVGDLLRFARALESGKLVSKKMFVEATKSQMGRYGYGFGVDGSESLQMWGHDGGAPGMNGELIVFPTLGYVLVSLSNFDPPAAIRPINYFEVRMPLAH
jgi:D-alanyl-D-alanine carboxypeptidase